MSRFRSERIGPVTLILGDALEVLPELAAEGRRFGALLADPPYSSGGVRDKAMAPSLKYLQSGSAAAGRYPEFQGDGRDQRSFFAWSTLWMLRARELVEPGGLCAVFSDWRQLPVTTDAVQAAGWIWRGVVPWDKTEGARPQKGRYRNQAEFVAWGSNGPRPLTGPVAPGVFRVPVRYPKHHIAGKPVSLMRGLLGVMSGPVLDPFAGSATVAVACMELGLECTSIEVDPAYFEIALRRLQGAFNDTQS